MGPVSDDQRGASYAYEATFKRPERPHNGMRPVFERQKSFLERMRSFLNVEFGSHTRMRVVSDDQISASYAYEVVAAVCFSITYGGSLKVEV